MSLLKAQGRLLRDPEVNYLNFGLRLEIAPTEQKRTLQRLCEWYEVGRRIQDPTHTRQLLHSLIGSENTLVRRWAIKALALIGHAEDFRRIANQLRVENDAEAQTWGVTGLVKNAQDRGLKELCELAGLPNSSAISLAARLYAPRSWIADHVDSARISLTDDELTLKWAIFLIGYGRAPEDLFHPKFSNELFLGELNVHPAVDIREYSIWALWERPEFGASYSKVPLNDARKHPESVRKWLYRLATKSPEDVGLDVDALSYLRKDTSAKAREGLAQGAADLPSTMYGDEILDWYTVESDVRVRENLLVSMAGRSGESQDYSEVVRRQFAKEAADSGMRHRLLAASVQLPLYADLRALDVADARAKQGLLEFGGINIRVEGDLTMGSKLNVGGNFHAQNVAVGDMIGSANAAVQRLQQSDEGTARALVEVLSMLERAKEVPGRAAVADAVKQVAQSPTPESKKSLLERVKGWVGTAATAGTILKDTDKVIDAVQGLLN